MRFMFLFVYKLVPLCVVTFSWCGAWDWVPQWPG